MLPQRHRLRKPNEFSSVLRAGGRSGVRRAGASRVVVHGGRVNQEVQFPARVGFIVSKAVGNAVVRHQVTRRLRGLMATRISQCAPGTDLVIRANPAAAQSDSSDLAQDLDRCLLRVLR